MTMPILVGTDGVQKMSKSLGNYVGVTDAPEEMFGRLMSIPDEAMAEYYRLLLGTEQPGVAPNEAKRELARRLVARFHDEDAAAAAEEHFNRLFVDRGAPEEMPDVALGDYLQDGDGLVHLPRLIGGAFEISAQRGPPPDPAGRGQARRRAVAAGLPGHRRQRPRRPRAPGRQAALLPAALGPLGKASPQRYTPPSFWGCPVPPHA